MSNDESSKQAGNICTNLANCPMFESFDSAASGRLFRAFYCEGKYQDCIRYQKSQRGESVSNFLLPNGSMLRAK